MPEGETKRMLKKISTRNRYLTLGIGLALSLVYVTPIWYIHLSAPQYPDGMSMSIWVDTITGGTEFDLQRINLLNHYVGMQTITPDSFAEFKVMPYVLAFMIFGSLLNFLLPRLFLIYAGILAFIAAAGAGFYDFWQWLYDYGHNLDPRAPISIPGFSYQPPVLGCTELLNFTACSWPHIAALLLFASGGVLLFIAFDEYRQSKIL